MNTILIIAHAPLAHALRTCALHVFPDCDADVAAIDVQPNLPPEETLAMARIAMDQLVRPRPGSGVLVLTDIFGATPGNVVSRMLQDGRIEGVSGVSLPMLLRVLSSRNGASKDALGAAVLRAVSGGAEGVVHMNNDRCLDA